VRIVDKSSATVSGLKILYHDQSLGLANVTAATVYFWNDGREPMRRSQVLSPYTIVIDETAKILDCKIIASLREVSKFAISNVQPLGQSVVLDFDIIEQFLDGVEVQIIYIGDPNAAISTKGVIEGASEPTRDSDEPNHVDVQAVAATMAFALLMMVGSAILIYLRVYDAMLVWFGFWRALGVSAAVLLIIFALAAYIPRYVNRVFSRRSVVAKLSRRFSP
jgi:hypothetical protein